MHKYNIRKDSYDKINDKEATQFTYDYGDMWEQYYDSVESNFDKTVKYIAAN